MDRLVDRVELGELEMTLRRIVAGARIVVAIWMVALVVVAGIRSQEDLGRTGKVLIAVSVIVAWSLVSLVVFRRAPDAVTSRAALVGDAMAGIVSLMAPTWADTDPSATFTGGLPLTVVAIASVRSASSAWAMSALMIATTVVRAAANANTDLGGGVVQSLSQVILYVAGAVIFTWIISTLRRADASRIDAERAAAHAEAGRAREAERSQISRHLHDSVLQTLALIQRSSESPGEVTMLARRQERELRDWLFGGSRQEGHLVEAVQAAAGEIEARQSVAVELVSVGDVELDDRLAQLVAAGREAMANAARHAGVESIWVYIEVGESAVRLFVRDRGVGFDRAGVERDRRGISESIEARMIDVGGTATLRTQPGRGTEWMLEVPR